MFLKCVIKIERKTEYLIIIFLILRTISRDIGSQRLKQSGVNVLCTALTLKKKTAMLIEVFKS